MSPASDPNLSDSESPEPPTPRVPLAWDACSVYYLFDGTESDFLGSKKLLPRNVTSDNVTHNNVTDSEEDPIETVRGGTSSMGKVAPVAASSWDGIACAGLGNA